MNDQYAKLIASKLDVVIKLLVLRLTQDKKQADQIRLLSMAGLAPKDIADMLGTTPNTVRVAISVLRKSSKLQGNKRKLKGRKRATASAATI